MYPYPSGDLHMGHAEAYALGDVVARYWIQRGFNVMHPIGWDSFGLPAENAAITRGLDPRGWTYDNIAQQKASMRRYACSSTGTGCWSPAIPEYYKWNQWLFLRPARERPGLPQAEPGQLVPEGPDRAGQRAGRRRPLRALRHPGDEEEADPVVLQDH
jgi:hypothetical protein